MRVRPVSPAVLTAELAETIGTLGARARPGEWLRVVLDGAPPARPGDLAARLVDPLRALGRPVLTVSARDFLRPASLRFEYGRTDPDAYYSDWLDLGALRREVLDPLGPDGTGRVLPSLWDEERDRATRAGYTELPPGGVLLLSGALLLGRDLPVEHAVHLWLSPAALARQTAEDQRWTLPAYARYEADARPRQAADLVVRMDNAEHPAIVED